MGSVRIARTWFALLAVLPAPALALQDGAARLRPEELALWNDGTFRRQLNESFVAESDIEPRVAAPEREGLQKVLDWIAKDQSDRALSELEKLRGPASSAVVDFMIANLHFQAERLDPAATAYQEATAKFPKFRRAWRNLALIRVRQNDHANAATALTRVLELGGTDATTFGLLAFCYSNLGKDLPAESAYRMANLLDPGTLDWRMGLARSFFQQKRYADAAALCGELLAEDPARHDLWLLQANAYIGMGQVDRAAQNYEMLDRMGRSTVDSLNMLGDIYVNAELFDVASDCYLRALELRPDAPVERSLRAAKVGVSRGELQATRALIERIEVIAGKRMSERDRKDVLKLRARVAVAEGAGDEEAAILEEIVALDPLDGEALLLLGQHALRNGDSERAVMQFERAAGIEAFEPDAKVRHAQLLVGQGRYLEALPLLRRAQAIRPRDNVQQYLDQVERIAQGR